MIGSLLQFSLALGGAVAIFLLGKLLVAGGHRAFEPALDWVRPRLGRIDQGLAVSVSGWLGLDERKAWRRWARLLAALVAPGLIGALAPWPLGVAALTLGLIAVLAVFRRWAWDEEDRALGLGAQDRRIPGGEDYGDEALAALAAVFMLSSLLVWRLTGAHAFEGPGAEGPAGYLIHILSEAFVSLPIVGNVELLGYQDPSGVRAVLPNGGAVAFALRMALDLMVIGGLLKAVEISRRIGRGQDLRREEEALASRELSRVLPSIGRVRRLALGGDANAMSLLSAVAAQSGQTPRARLCAIHALREIAGWRPEWAAAILLDNQLACYAVLNDPATAEAGLLGAAYLESAEIAMSSARISQDHVAANLVDRAVAEFGHALRAPGLTPLPEAFLLDHPEQISPVAHVGTVLRLSKLLVTKAELSHPDSRIDILTDALRHVELAFHHMPEVAPPDLRFRARQYHAEALARLGQLDTGYDGSVKLTDALDAFAGAEALLDENDLIQRVSLRMGRGVVHEILGARSEGPQALGHFAEAAELFESAGALMAEAQADSGETAQCFLNLGNACRFAADEAAETRAWLDRALQAYSTALRTVGDGDWPAHEMDALDGLAATHLDRFRHFGEKDDVLKAIGCRLRILEEIDPRQAPVEWALAAIQASQAQHLALPFAASTAVSRTARDRLLQARDLLDQAGEGEEARRCDTLIEIIEAEIAERDDPDQAGT
ncbi:hypothetical protein [Phenylobacterium sp.]|uniref:hypothetical protein n=1 Tax=Phenylobacterium sp. TaxID=1871053 RepID=UPI0028A1451E|nr:hypothetical protein [Phenylobacterium sp.]